MSDATSLIHLPTVLLDGAWGTELQALGLLPGTCPDVWNLTQPERVERVARSYVDAGSQIILTNTFGANRIMLSRHGLVDSAKEINLAGAALSQRAAANKALVFASVGPTGKMLAIGDVTEPELRGAFEEQLSALAEGGVDGVVLETFTDLDELGIALAAAKRARLLTIGCMVFDSGAAKDRTAMGVTPERAVERLAREGADGIGANCGRGIDAFVPICQRLRAATQLPLWIKPNAGLPEIVDGKIHYATTPEQFAAGTTELVRAGANLVGGCCGTSPAFIRAMARALSPQ
jgi:5-methyltetrahydrofolate--homocysteine methyltransferase